MREQGAWTMLRKADAELKDMSLQRVHINSSPTSN